MISSAPRRQEDKSRPAVPAPREPETVDAAAIARRRPEVAAVLRRLHNI